MILELFFCFGLVLSCVQGIDLTTFRLQRHVSPTSYSLKIVPDVDGDTFRGEVTIYLKTAQPISNVTLNSKNLRIDEIILDQNYGTTKYILDPAHEMMYVLYADGENIDPGEHILHIRYTGRYGAYHGFYKLQSAETNNQIILTTKFSSNYAREAFPCFDEPYFKSIFDIRLVKPNNTWDVISNMRKIARYETVEGIAVDFQSTVPMSTYLLAWAYTNYGYEEIMYTTENRTIPLRFYAAKNDSLVLRSALKNTKKALSFFENYTGIPFPLSKLDSITIPAYRSKGMEHYGLITYQENAIFNPSPFTSKLFHSLDALLLICHEVSHMWFGNLVTHQWFNDLWLTEGFARYMQYKAGVAALGEPFVTYMFQESKYLTLSQEKCFGDAVETGSFPRKLNQIRSKYTPSTYDQGAGLLMMLEDVMGEDKFREAVRNNLREHSYSYSTTGEFINLMQDVAPTLNIREVMLTYLFQNKLPLVNVTMDKDFFILRQSPLCYDGVRSFFGDKWSFPIRYITSSNMTSSIAWFDREMTHVAIPRAKNDEWIQINHRSVGLYRVKYTREMYEAIGNNFQKLPRVDIGPLVEDAFFLSSQGIIPCDIPLKLIAALRDVKDIDFLTFTYASRSFTMFTSNFHDIPKVERILRSFFMDVFKGLYHKVTWNVGKHETTEERLLRMQVLESFCLRSQNYPECYKDVKSLTIANVTVHEDIDYIYKATISKMKKKNSSAPLSEPSGKEETDLTEKDAGMEKCISWIKQHIPKIDTPEILSNAEA